MKYFWHIGFAKWISNENDQRAGASDGLHKTRCRVEATISGRVARQDSEGVDGALIQIEAASNSKKQRKSSKTAAQKRKKKKKKP